AGQGGRATGQTASPIAGRLRPGGARWTTAFRKALAGLPALDCSLCRQREVRRRRRRQLLAAAATLLCLGAAIRRWHYVRVKAVYYQDLASRWSVPEGIVEISSDKVRHVGVSYRFESSRRKVRRVTMLNG